MKIVKKDEQSLLIKVFGIKDRYYLSTSRSLFFPLNSTAGSRSGILPFAPEEPREKR